MQQHSDGPSSGSTLNFAKIVLKEWFDEGDLCEISDGSVLWMIKKKLTKEAMMMVRWMVIRKVG